MSRRGHDQAESRAADEIFGLCCEATQSSEQCSDFPNGNYRGSSSSAGMGLESACSKSEPPGSSGLDARPSIRHLMASPPVVMATIGPSLSDDVTAAGAVPRGSNDSGEETLVFWSRG